MNVAWVRFPCFDDISGLFLFVLFSDKFSQECVLCIFISLETDG